MWSRVLVPLEYVGGVFLPFGFVTRTKFSLAIVVAMLIVVEGYECAGRKGSLKSPPIIMRWPRSLALLTFVISVSYI